MGTVFGFVASDVTSKLDILQNFRDGTNGDKFTSVEEMIKFEKRENLLVDSKYVSGCRTLLRLHRALRAILNNTFNKIDGIIVTFLSRIPRFVSGRSWSVQNGG